MADAKVKPEEEQKASEQKNENEKDKENEKEKEKEKEVGLGPVEDRHCTDILCFIFYCSSFILFFNIFGLGLKNGEPERLIAAYDSSNKSCGIDYPDKPYLYWPMPIPDQLNRTTCVESCPQKDLVTGQLPFILNCNKNKMVLSCSGTLQNPEDLEKVLKGEVKVDPKTMFLIYETFVFGERVCFPGGNLADSVESLKGLFEGQMDVGELQKWVNQLKVVWPLLAGSVGWGFFFGLVFMGFTYLFSGIIIWAGIAGYFYLLLMLGFYLNKQSELVKAELLFSQENNSATEYTENDQKMYEYGSYAVFGFTALSFIVLVFQRNNIRLAIAIIKTAALYVKDTPLAMLVPPVFTLIVAAWWAIWIVGFIYLYAWGEFFKNDFSFFGQVAHTEQVFYFLWIFTFLGLWTNALIQAIAQFILCSAPCMWYFSGGGNNGYHRPIFRSIYRIFRYHLGSLAFGAFLLAVVQIIRLILEYINHQSKQLGISDNKVAMYILKCLRCYMECFERFVKFINKNAYIQIALTGDNFCTACKNAFVYIFTNPARFALINGIGGAFILFGKMFIILACLFISYLFLIKVEPYKSEVSSPFLPLFIILFIVYAIAQIFMFVYGLGIDSIFMCFLYDEKESKARGQEAKYCPDTLKMFLEQNEKK